MATYYRWRRYTIGYSESISYGQSIDVPRDNDTIWYSNEKPSIVNGQYQMGNSITVNDDRTFNNTYWVAAQQSSNVCYRGDSLIVYKNTGVWRFYSESGSVEINTVSLAPGTSQGYVYSTSSSAYPNGGVSGGYYYDQRTTVTSPTAPTGLTYPATITTPSVDISWTAATSNTNYPVSGYQVDVSTNGGTSWTTAGTPTTNSLSYSIPAGTTSVMFRVRAKDSNGQWGSYVTGTQSQVILAPDLTAPPMVMQGQPATISWTAIEGADSYTLQRKSSADTDWTQVYSGTDTTFTETAGTWTSLQYRVQAVFDGTGGGWATSDPIQIVSASALVISGQDGDLGTLTSDVPYSISSDQASPTIDVTVEVNGGEYASFQATSGESYSVGVLDLPTGTGSIVITASAEVSGSPVSVTRTWTYSKTAASFPSNGSVARLTQEGATVYPETLAEAVRTAMTPWGGNLSTVLDLLSRAALYNRTQSAKYSEVTISMANVTEGQIVNIPRGGVMVPHYVGKLEYESGLNGAGRRLLVPVECYNQRTWDAGSGYVNAYATSDIDAWMNSTYKALFPEEIQTAMGTTEFYYTPGNGNNTVTTLERAIFSLSATELGQSESWFNIEGSTLPISDALKISHLNGIPSNQWTRSPKNDSTNSAVYMNSDGDVNYRGCAVNGGSRPVFTLPSTFTYGPVYVDQGGTIHASQEYTEAGDWLDVWGNAIPAVHIETGSYVGTGTSGSSNPNTLTFGFEPHVVFVAGMSNSNPGTGGDDNVEVGLFFPDILQEAYKASSYFLIGRSGSQYYCAKFEDATNTLSWYYYASGASSQLNYSGKTYFYVAIG